MRRKKKSSTRINQTREEKKSSTEMNQTRAKTKRHEKAKKIRTKMTSQKSKFQLQQRHSDLSNALQEESEHSESEWSRWVKDYHTSQSAFADLQWSCSVLQFDIADHWFKFLVLSFALASLCN